MAIQGRLRCERLIKTFDGVRALDAFDMEFPDAGIVAIVGPNGAGKTTLIDVICGVIRPDGGRVMLGSEELTGLCPQEVAALGIARTFQELRLIAQVPVMENVLLARPRQRGERLASALLSRRAKAEESANRSAAEAFLKAVGLEGRAVQLVRELSYGQQKLLSLACCIATEAEVLLLDEPVAGLDPNTRRDVLALLLRLRGDGRRILFIEHDMEAVRQVADQVIVMANGTVIAAGCPSEVLAQREIQERYLG